MFKKLASIFTISIVASCGTTDSDGTFGGVDASMTIPLIPGSRKPQLPSMVSSPDVAPSMSTDTRTVASPDTTGNALGQIFPTPSYCCGQPGAPCYGDTKTTGACCPEGFSDVQCKAFWAAQEWCRCEGPRTCTRIFESDEKGKAQAFACKVP